MPSVIITGASGLLGRQVLRVFQQAGWTALGTALSRVVPPLIRLDITDSGHVDQLIMTHQSVLPQDLTDSRPQLIVHCAANRYPDRCDSDPVAACKVNVDATRNLALAAQRVGAMLLYISTDYVFSGRPGEAPYPANAPCLPPNVYGQTKFDGEQIIHKLNQTRFTGVILRVPVLYGDAENNEESAVNTLVDAVWRANSSDNVIKMDHWAKRYPTNTEDVARVCRDIAHKYLAGPSGLPSDLPAVIQFSAEDVFTKYEMCKIFADILGLSTDQLEAQTNPATGIQRPYDTHLSTQSLKQLGVPVHTLDFRAWWWVMISSARLSIADDIEYSNLDSVVTQEL